jgi:hypothetical protein
MLRISRLSSRIDVGGDDLWDIDFGVFSSLAFAFAVLSSLLLISGLDPSSISTVHSVLLSGSEHPWAWNSTAHIRLDVSPCVLSSM